MADAGQAVLLDANLLVLLAVGRFDRRLVGRKRLKSYAADDFDLLVWLIRDYPRNLTTPHLLAEVSNLADQCVPKELYRDFRTSYADLVDNLDERWTSARELCRTPSFAQLGLADASAWPTPGRPSCRSMPSCATPSWAAGLTW